MTDAMRVLDEAIAGAPATVAGGAGARSSASSCAWRSRRASASSMPIAWSTRSSRCSSARATTTGSAGRGRCAPRRAGSPGRWSGRLTAWCEAAVCAAESGRRARALRDRRRGARPRPCSAPLRSTTPSDAARRSATLVERQSGRARMGGQRARVAARDERSTSSWPTSCWSRPTRRSSQLGSLHSSVSHHRGARAGCSRASPRWRSHRCAPAIETLASMTRPARCWRRRPPCSPRPSTRQGASGGRPAVPDAAAERRGARRHRHAGDLARREGEDPRPRGPL